MAGEFFVMGCLFRLGHEPALTLGNAKSIDVLVKTPSGVKEISVKAVQGGGKWPVDKGDLSGRENLVFVFLRYRDREFGDPKKQPDVWVMRAAEVEKRKRPWFAKSAIYYTHGKHAPVGLDQFRDRWDFVG